MLKMLPKFMSTSKILNKRRLLQSPSTVDGSPSLSVLYKYDMLMLMLMLALLLLPHMDSSELTANQFQSQSLTFQASKRGQYLCVPF